MLRSKTVCFLLSLTFLFNITFQQKFLEEQLAEITTTMPGQTASSLSFYQVGDYGFTTDATTIDPLFQVIDKQLAIEASDFIVTSGDNIYMNGISSPDDPKVQITMDFFDKQYLGTIPIHPVLGNHDCYGDYRALVGVSDRFSNWEMDSDYYAKTYPLGEGSTKKAGFLFLNGCLLLCKDYSNLDCKDMQINSKNVTDIANHYGWIEDKLKEWSEDPTIVWTSVVIHFPLFSIGMIHGDAIPIKQYLLPILQKYKVDGFLCGHEHNAQFSLSKPNMQQVIPSKEEAEESARIESVLEKLDLESGLDNIDKETLKIINKNGCKLNIEILPDESRVYNYKKGTAVGNFLIGSSGNQRTQLCPLKPTDGELIYANNLWSSFAKYELTEDTYTVIYYSGEGDEKFRVEIQA